MLVANIYWLLAVNAGPTNTTMVSILAALKEKDWKGALFALNEPANFVAGFLYTTSFKCESPAVQLASGDGRYGTTTD